MVPIELALSQVASALSQYFKVPLETLEESIQKLNSKGYNEALAVALIALDDLVLYTLKNQ